MIVRPGRTRDATTLRQIEVAAGARFRDVGMGAIADDEPPEPDDLLAAAAEHRLWVAEIDGRVVGYALGVVVGDQPHLEQVSTLPDYQGRGVGRALIDAVDEWAGRRGAARLTLTTFRDVPWNAPLYEHLGFSVVPSDELAAPMRELRDHERARGLDDAGPRVVMARTVGPVRD